MPATALRYDRWKAPSGDGELLVWPGPARLLKDTRDNHARLNAADRVSIQNIPLAELRRDLRRWLGFADDAMVVGTGHQAELHHPGVWAKNALIHAAASALGGESCHVAVDTDEPKHLQLRFPGGAVPLLDDPDTTAAWTGLLPAPTPAHLEQVRKLVRERSAGWSFAPSLDPYLDCLARAALAEHDLPTAMTQALHELDWELGLRHHTMLASPIWNSPAYLTFAHHVLARIDRFSADYNAALADYRVQNKIRSPGRPMPDLACAADGCEAPFWLDALGEGTRERASVVRLRGGRFALRDQGGDAFEFDPGRDGHDAAAALQAWLTPRRLRLSPRALTLTAVLRLLAMDNFAHGIGGGQYDQVLDALIQRHFQLDPPRFCVTTATLYFPQPTREPRVCLPCIVQEGRRQRHDLLGAEKMALVRQIEQLPRRSIERSRLFYQMHDQLTAAWRGVASERFEQRYHDAEQRESAERIYHDRELFFALQPRERLVSLIEQFKAAFQQ